MKSCFSNATVLWEEDEIIFRENLVKEIVFLINKTCLDLNQQFKMFRVETPIITPEKYLQSHIDTNFNLIKCDKRGILRPETTIGTYEAFDILYGTQYLKKLPLCLYQLGLSFRDEEKSETMRASKLRLVQFYQLEFQIFCSDNTKAPYIENILNNLTKRYGGEYLVADELPHYSELTLDWYIKDLEVAGCSIRKDWKHGKVFEIAIGIDRLVALLLENKRIIYDCL